MNDVILKTRQISYIFWNFYMMLIFFFQFDRNNLGFSTKNNDYRRQYLVRDNKDYELQFQNSVFHFLRDSLNLFNWLSIGRFSILEHIIV